MRESAKGKYGLECAIAFESGHEGGSYTAILRPNCPISGNSFPLTPPPPPHPLLLSRLSNESHQATVAKKCHLLSLGCSLEQVYSAAPRDSAFPPNAEIQAEETHQEEDQLLLCWLELLFSALPGWSRDDSDSLSPSVPLERKGSPWWVSSPHLAPSALAQT